MGAYIMQQVLIVIWKLLRALLLGLPWTLFFFECSITTLLFSRAKQNTEVPSLVLWCCYSIDFRVEFYSQIIFLLKYGPVSGALTFVNNYTNLSCYKRLRSLTQPNQETSSPATPLSVHHPSLICASSTPQWCVGCFWWPDWGFAQPKHHSKL